MNFGSQNGKKRGFLALYILHALDQRPQSGYDLLKEIGKKTQGMWIPSKGTLYPLLHQMEYEGLIVAEIAKNRYKTIYELTSKGKETLLHIKEQSRESHKKMALYKNLILDVFKNEKVNMKGLLYQIRTTLEDIPPGYEDRIVTTLETCLADLKRIT
ncbi:MAG: PadR family transcriptional regulator [Methanomicrobiales archaeon]|nr:PadR family transcriptional regulator [Methanomicrobiales archaeon]